MSRTGRITRSIDTFYGGLFVRASADKRARRAIFKFATELFGERAGHPSARVCEDRIDRNDASVV